MDKFIISILILQNSAKVFPYLPHVGTLVGAHTFSLQLIFQTCDFYVHIVLKR